MKNPDFVAKTLTNNLKLEDYARAKNVEALIDVFSVLKDRKVTVVLAGQAISKILETPDFDYECFFKANSIDEEKLHMTLNEIIADNPVISDQVRSGNLGKAGVLVGKVMEVLGKGTVSGNDVRQRIIELLTNKQQQVFRSATKKSKSTSNTDSAKEIVSASAVATPIVIKDHYRTHCIKELTESDIGKSMELSGWVNSVRDHGELVFIDLREADGQLLQVRLSSECFPNLEALVKLKPESVISVSGVLILRDSSEFNPSIKTGQWELQTSSLQVLNLSQTLPFEIKKAMKTNEQIRFKYKFLDHRNIEVRRAIVNRHRVIKLIRDVLDDKGFLEIETPILTAGTDEGAREFIVPSRKVPGAFYTLPQAPQQIQANVDGWWF